VSALQVQANATGSARLLRRPVSELSVGQGYFADVNATGLSVDPPYAEVRGTLID
jgi:hypothetical protein